MYSECNAETQDSTQTPQREVVGQSVCVDEAAEWSDSGPQESECKRESLEPNTSVQFYSNPNPIESQSSPQTLLNASNGEEQQMMQANHTIHTPLMMCSVRLVDCRTMVELNRNVTQEEQLNDGSVRTENHGEPEEAEESEELKVEHEEADEVNDYLCPIGKSISVVLLIPQKMSYNNVLNRMQTESKRNCSQVHEYMDSER